MLKQSVATVSLTIALLALLVAPAPAQTPVRLTDASTMPRSADQTDTLLRQPARLMIERVFLVDALEQLSERSGVPLAYSRSLLPQHRRISCFCEELTVAEALDLILADLPLGYASAVGQVVILPEALPSPEPTTRLAATPVSVDAVTPPTLRDRLTSFWPFGQEPVVVAGVNQETFVAGIVVDAQSLAPLPGAQIVVEGTDRGTISDARGRFRIGNLRGREIALRVMMIGYESLTQTVRVGDPAVQLGLRETAIKLDQIVVTGTAGGTQTRAIGNVVGQLDADEIAETGPITSMQQLIGQRTPGVAVLPGNGVIGTGGLMRIRGVGSLSLSNGPLIYVDGVRVDNNPRGGPPIREGRQVNRLNDFSPEEIESIEIIKGPAAATLYGTEASNGVIQIITKRGTQGPPIVELAIQQGANWMHDPEGRFNETYWTDESGVVHSMNIYAREKAAGRDIFQTGRLQSYSGSVRGGTDDVRYFLSADYGDNEGIVSYNWQKRLNARANLALVPSEHWDLNVTTGYVQGRTRFAQAASGYGIWDQIVWSSPAGINTPTRGFLRATPEAAAAIESYSEINRFTGSLQANWQPWEWIGQRLTVGLDAGDEISSRLFPKVPEGEFNFYGSRGDGEKLVESRRVVQRTFDYGATAFLQVTQDLESATSVGAQYHTKQIRTSSTLGRNFPTPVVTTVGGAATTEGSEDFVENKTLGVYLQEQFNWKNRLFLTGAVRADDNSAFGRNFDIVTYPKFSATWVLNEEPFWNVGFVNTLRLRTAWGMAGQQPDVFDAIRFYDPITGQNDGAGLTPGSFGNPDLKPERGEELEVGFDAGLFDDRLSINFTYYDQTTKDAILQRRVSPSTGFSGFQMVNLGELKNWGTEWGIDARVVETGPVTWDLGVSFSTNHSRVEDLGGLPPVSVAVDQEHREGFPIASIFWYRVVNADFDSNGELTNVLCDGGEERNHEPVPCDQAPRVYMGQPNPKWMGNVTMGFTILQNLRVNAVADFTGGHQLIYGDIQGGHTSFTNTKATNPVTDPIFQAYREIVPRTPLGLYDAGFAKLREISGSYTFSEDWARPFGASRASFTLAARNLATFWRAQEELWGATIFDSETRDPISEHGARIQTTIPQLTQVIATLRVTF